MLYLAENLRKYRMMRGMTQEDVAQMLGITPQSVSKWERAESYPDITFLPAIANLLETSIDLLIGMDTIRAEETRWRIHEKATSLQRNGKYEAAEKVYRDALLIYPNKPGMLLGLAGVLALEGKTIEAIERIEKGLSLSENSAQQATMRAVLCFLYAKNGEQEKAESLAKKLPHQRESREAVLPLLQNSEGTVWDRCISRILLGE